MAIRIIALDMDGTLMAPDHLTVTQRTRNALQHAHDAGVKIAIATGRTMAYISDVFDQVPMVDYVIQSNGAAVFDRKKNEYIYTSLLDWDFSKKIIEYIETLPVFYEIYAHGKSYANPQKAQFFSNPEVPRGFIDHLMNNMELHTDVVSEISGNNLEKINLYCPDSHLDSTLFDRLWQEFSAIEGVDVASALPGAIEMTRKGVTKGSALAGLCDALGFTPNQAMAFGDAGNDCPMLQLAKYSFAMENGTDQCKKSAKYIAPSNADDGVAKMVEKFVLDKCK